MAQSKKELERRQKEWKAELAVLEAKCKDGSGTKDDYIALTKMRKKMG
ncbi:MAG: hypothetical protein Q7R76_02235 [Candidatus Woesearchaeota archaeon]|nr:hypothetical protein [Candidatus Woesearchaeota archaeon]